MTITITVGPRPSGLPNPAAREGRGDTFIRHLATFIRVLLRPALPAKL